MQISDVNLLFIENSDHNRPVIILGPCVRLILIIFLFSLLIRVSLAGTIDTITISSNFLKKQSKALIVLPDDYQSAVNFLYPSVYLLHGWSGCFSDWNNHINLGTLADRFHMIIICPDGGYSGWYLDSPYKTGSQYETHLIKEVIPTIENLYRVAGNAENRFICGLSMGGYGALRLISRFPELFAAAGSMSGVLHLNTKIERYGLVELLGDSLSNSRLWQENSCINMLPALRHKSRGIIIDCGIDDPYIEMNRTLHSRLLSIGLDHEYWERPGTHNWSYWINALEFHLLYFQKRLQIEK